MRRHLRRYGLRLSWHAIERHLKRYSLRLERHATRRLLRLLLH